MPAPACVPNAVPTPLIVADPSGTLIAPPEVPVEYGFVMLTTAGSANESVPPLRPRGWLPKAPAAAGIRVPPVTVTPPESVFDAASTSVPAPLFVSVVPLKPLFSSRSTPDVLDTATDPAATPAPTVTVPAVVKVTLSVVAKAAGALPVVQD